MVCVWCAMSRTDGQQYHCIERLINETTVLSFWCMFMLDIQWSDWVSIRIWEYCLFWYETGFQWCAIMLSMYECHDDKMLFCILDAQKCGWVIWKRDNHMMHNWKHFSFRFFFFERFKVYVFLWAVEGFWERFSFFVLLSNVLVYCCLF